MSFQLAFVLPRWDAISLSRPYFQLDVDTIGRQVSGATLPEPLLSEVKMSTYACFGLLVEQGVLGQTTSGIDIDMDMCRLSCQEST